MSGRSRLSFALVVGLSACTRFGAVYPPRPAPAEAPPVADPAPAKVVVHLAVTADGLRDGLEENVPRRGDGTVPLLGGDRAYAWEREPLAVSFSQGRIEITTRARVTLTLPLKSLSFGLDLAVKAEPVVDTRYALKLQSVEVSVRSPDRTLAIADRLGDVYARIEAPLRERLGGFAYDLAPLLGGAYARLGAPMPLPLGDATACASLKVLEIEAGPTVLADGLEKDFALVVAPSIVLPCPPARAPDANAAPALPPLSNVSTLATGPFTVTVPVAARYDELTRAMTMAFTDGKLFFSSQFPEAYLEKPELYEAGGVVVLKLHIAGPVHALGIDTVLDGDLFLSGHPAIVDNELTIPDLQPTVETTNFLLSLKAMKDSDKIRDQARAALRLDIGARIAEARAKIGESLTFGDAKACARGAVDRVEITGVFAHAAYLRAYVAVTGRARAEVPCAAAVTP